MRHSKWAVLLAAVSILVTAGCAKQTMPPPQPVIIPVQLVNIEDSIVVGAPDLPDESPVMRITTGDRADRSLTTTLVYLGLLRKYAREVTSQLEVSESENAELRAKLKKIKQYILLQQAQRPPLNST